MKQRKRICFFNGTLNEGGAERVISILSKGLASMNYDVEILLYYEFDPFYEIAENINIVFVEKSTRSKNYITNLVWMRNYFKENADIVISFLAPFNILALIAHLGLKNKIIVADRNDPRCIPNKYIIRKLRNFLYQFSDGVVLQTQKNKSYFSKSIQDRSIVIYNPIDLKEKRGQALRTETNKRIVSVGRLMPQKNHELLMDAFAEVVKVYPEYELTIYGEGPERYELEKKIVSLKLSDKVFLPGSMKDIFDEISDAELFVLSSDYEGMPNALIEAMCLGLPCISTKVSGAIDLISDDLNGELVDIGDNQGLATCIIDLLGNVRKKEQYSNNAEKLNDKLTNSIIIEEWGKYIEKVYLSKLNKKIDWHL